MDIQKLYKEQHLFFKSNQTKKCDFRIDQLKKVKSIFQANEKLLFEAIHKDFGKSQFDTYTSELSLFYHEIDHIIANLKRWSKPKRRSSRLVNFPAKSYIIPEPLGVTLVIGAWNYPYQLSLVPAITSLGAGNTVILKPSELPANTSAIMAKLINENFSSEYFHVIEGGVDKTTELLSYRYDKIFFTGSTTVGKIIYQAAAKQLSPVTLELGGKSPAFIFADCDLKVTAKRLVWAKFFNAGQTCVAPDYILVEKFIEEEFLKALKKEIKARYTSQYTDSENYTQIINLKNFDRLIGLIDKGKVYCGGNTDRENRFISPTILQNITFEDEVMKEEIFGPILPILSFENLDATIKLVKEKPSPLSLYVYSKNKKTIQKILHEVPFGGGCINDSLMHLTENKLPFGGVGLSGIGSYHGKFGFDAFSHFKSILHKPFWLEFDLKYAPYSIKKQKIIKWLIG